MLSGRILPPLLSHWLPRFLALGASLDAWLTPHLARIRENFSARKTWLILLILAYLLAYLSSLYLGSFVPIKLFVDTNDYTLDSYQIENIRQQAMAGVLQRNFFNSLGIIPPDEKANLIPILSPSPLKLVGTLVMAQEAYSAASVFDSEEKKTYTLMLDDLVRNTLTVVRIEERRVYFKNVDTDGFEYIEMPEDKLLPLQILGDVAADDKTSENNRSSGKKVTLSREEIEKILANPSKILADARAIPFEENGLSGLKFVEVYPHGFFEKIGLKPGDFVTSVNGSSLKSIDQGLVLYQQLKNHLDDSLEVSLVRNGQTTTLRYQFN